MKDLFPELQQATEGNIEIIGFGGRCQRWHAPYPRNFFQKVNQHHFQDAASAILYVRSCGCCS